MHMMDLGLWSENSGGPRMLSMEEPERTSRPALNPISIEEAKELNRPQECRPVESRRLSGGRPVLMRVKGQPGFANAIHEDLAEDRPVLPGEPRESLFDSSALVPRKAPEVESVRQKENKQKPEAAFALPSARATAGRRTKKSTQGRSSNAAPCALASPLPVYVDDEFQDGKVFEDMPSCLPPKGTRKSRGAAKVTPDSESPRPPPCTPAAPQKESRRKRRAAQEAAEETASSSLAASMSQLHIREEPPAKRACRIPEKPTSKPSTPQTPPRRRDPFAPRRRNGKSPGLERSWSPPRTSPRQPGRGSNTFSSAKSQKDTTSSQRSRKSELDQEGLAGLQALQGMFGTRRGYGRSCSRLLVFED